MKVYPIDLYNGLLSTMNLDRQLGYIIPAMKKVSSPKRTYYSRVGYPKVRFIIPISVNRSTGLPGQERFSLCVLGIPVQNWIVESSTQTHSSGMWLALYIFISLVVV